MDEPSVCSICGARLRQMKHLVAHGGMVSRDARIRICPHNLRRADRYLEPRHDEWHFGSFGWVKREP